MAAHVLRLRIALLFGALRGERAARTIIGVVVLALLTTLACIAVFSLADAPADVARSVLVLGGAAVVVGFLVGPIIIGVSDQLDPRRFRVFGVDERQMPWILALASLISVPVLSLIALCVCVTIVVIQHGAPVAAAAAMGIAGVLIPVLASRVGMAINAQYLPERRARELTTLFVLAVLIVAFPAAIFFASIQWRGDVPSEVLTAATVVGFTPFGAPSAFLFNIAVGDVSGSWITAAVAVLALAALWFAWSALVRTLLTTTERPITARERSGLGWFAVLPPNAFGAVAARSLIYWIRDRRYIVNVVIVPIAAALAVLPLLVAGVPFGIAILVPVPVMALFFGWLPHNDVAYDSTAFWIHVASAVNGRADRLGRLVPVALIAVPVLAISIPITLSLAESWYLLLPMSALAFCLLCAGFGVSSIVSVISPYAVSRPGDSPFQQPQRARPGIGGQAGTFLGALLLSLPTLWFFVRTIADGEQFSVTTFWVGLGSGILVLAVGAAIGGRILQRGGERLMEFVETA